MKKKVKFKIKIAPDNRVNAFAYYLSPSVKKGTAEIRINFSATLDFVKNSKEDFYKVLAELTTHELLHAIEDIFRNQFNEKEIRECFVVKNSN